MQKIELEVVRDRDDGSWHVQVREKFNTLAEADTVASDLGRRLGKTGVVEKFFRRLNGTYGDRDTYPRQADPPKSKG